MDHQKKKQLVASAILSLALIFALGASGLGQDVLTVPVGTVIPMRMDTSLSSNSTRIGDSFTAIVSLPVIVDGRTAIAEGTRVEGHVTGVSSGERGSAP